jgi:hypothetical protein
VGPSPVIWQAIAAPAQETVAAIRGGSGRWCTFFALILVSAYFVGVNDMRIVISLTSLSRKSGIM